MVSWPPCVFAVGGVGSGRAVSDGDGWATRVMRRVTSAAIRYGQHAPMPDVSDVPSSACLPARRPSPPQPPTHLVVDPSVVVGAPAVVLPQAVAVHRTTGAGGERRCVRGKVCGVWVQGHVVGLVQMPFSIPFSSLLPPSCLPSAPSSSSSPPSLPPCSPVVQHHINDDAQAQLVRAVHEPPHVLRAAVLACSRGAGGRGVGACGVRRVSNVFRAECVCTGKAGGQHCACSKCACEQRGRVCVCACVGKPRGPALHNSSMHGLRCLPHPAASLSTPAPFSPCRLMSSRGL